MIRPYILSETNFEFLEQHRYELAILPWGATEAHNFHLPYGTDNYQVEAIAAESARLAWENAVNLVVLPIFGPPEIFEISSIVLFAIVDIL